MSEPDDDADDCCQRCGGDGWTEADDPINDDTDEFGFVECPACGGSGYLPELVCNGVSDE